MAQILLAATNFFKFIHTSRDHGVSDWICVEDGTATYSIPYDGTTIIETDPDGSNSVTKVSSASSGSRGTFAITKYKLYFADRAVNLFSEGEHHRLIPITNKGTKFGNYASRNAPSTIHIYNPGTSAVTISVYDNVTGGIGGTATSTINLDSGRITTYSTTTLSAWVLFESTGDIVMSATQTGTDRSVLNPADTNAFIRRATTAWRDMTNSTPSTIGSPAYTASDTDLVVGAVIGDGAGGDYELALGINNLANRYSFGNAIGDYFVLSPYASTTVDVKYWNGSSWATHATHSLNGSLASPAVHQEGTLSGAGTNLQSGATNWLWEADNPIFLAINDTTSDEETMLGWMDGRKSSQGIRNGVISGWTAPTITAIVSAWGAGGAGGNVNSSGDGEDAGPGGNGGFVEFRIEGLKGTETIYAYPGGGGSGFTDEDDGDAGGGGAATLVYITDGVNTDYLCVVGGGGGGGGVGSDPDNFDATAGGEGGAAGGNGADAENVGLGAVGGGGGTQSAGGNGPGGADNGTGPGVGEYAGEGGDGGGGENEASLRGAAGAGGVVGHSFGGAGGSGGLEGGNAGTDQEGGGGGGGGGYYGGGGGEGDDSTNDAGAGGGGGSTNLNTSPSGFTYLTITQISTSAGTASPTVQHDGAASTQTAGSTNEFSVSVGGQGGDGGQVDGAAGSSGSNGRVAVGVEGGTATINTTSTSGASSLASNL